MKIKALEQIEKLRLQMQEIASDKDLTDPMVRVSERLDILINDFYISQEIIKGVVEELGQAS